jgi:hypothetical protein
MMDPRHLERVIDTAAGELIAREPSHALSYNVMARVRENVKPSSHRLVWITAPAIVLLCAAIAVAILNRSPQPLPAVAAAPPLAIRQALAVVEPPIVLAHDMAPSRRNRSSLSSRTIASNTTALPRDVSPIAPLETEPIAVAVIDVPRLESFAPVSIEALDIEQLTIEPLVASND